MAVLIVFVLALAMSASAYATVTESITYQGQLSDAGGEPVNDTVPMRFRGYEGPAGGSALFDTDNMQVQVTGGFFTANVPVPQEVLDGRALWLQIDVAGQTLSPRQEITPAPYAHSLRPGASTVGPPQTSVSSVFSAELSGGFSSAAALVGRAPASGTAVRATGAGGKGLVAASNSDFAVWGSSTNSVGGYFQSSQGYGIVATTGGSDHWDHAGFFQASGGYGILATSANNMGVRGQGGDVTGISNPLGAVGVAGIGQNRGVYGSSGNGVGVYGTSNANYAGYFYANGYRGIYSSSASGYYAGYLTNRGGSAQPGAYINGTLTVTGSKSGYVVDICLNDGPEPLEVGGVVAVVGVSEPVLGEIPVMRVVKATADNASAAVGVVDQRFVVGEEDGESLAWPEGNTPELATNSGIQFDEYLSVVTLGAFKLIKVDATYGAIRPGDLLTPSPNAGYAMRTAEGWPGTIIGKALEALETGQDAIAVYVTMQ
jgi:hypothetical protein